ncbi:hypothetical protein GE061_014427 [Apolygus lucorum]|uniref:Uncharacterized protein n=1 Tax=Apolygus lucorum TaxID=248454 RepID=A0A8S9XQL6_APOLU|nr:hypothetical protein GE061_014427 [Apolygus lucorum]
MEYEFMTGNAPMNEGVVTKNGVRIEVINAVVTIKQEVLIKDEQGKKEEVGDFGGSPKAKLSDGQSTADSTMLGWSSNEGDDLSSCGRQDCETGPSSEISPLRITMRPSSNTCKRARPRSAGSPPAALPSTSAEVPMPPPVAPPTAPPPPAHARDRRLAPPKSRTPSAARHSSELRQVP